MIFNAFDTSIISFKSIWFHLICFEQFFFFFLIFLHSFCFLLFEFAQNHTKQFFFAFTRFAQITFQFDWFDTWIQSIQKQNFKISKNKTKKPKKPKKFKRKYSVDETREMNFNRRCSQWFDFYIFKFNTDRKRHALVKFLLNIFFFFRCILCSLEIYFSVFSKTDDFSVVWLMWTRTWAWCGALNDFSVCLWETILAYRRSKCVA